MGRKLKKSSRKKKEKTQGVDHVGVFQEAQDKPSLTEKLQEAEEATALQGACCEVQVFPEVKDTREEYEASNRLADKCTKNPGHADFIPINQLRLHHLPDLIRNETYLNNIKHVSNSTVKLTVRYTSPDRPARFSTGAPPGSHKIRIGTGYVQHAPRSSVKEYKGGRVFIINTAAHIVYDNAEAKMTNVEIFFDNEIDKSGVITAKGIQVIQCEVEQDWCQFSCLVTDKRDSDFIRKTLDYGEGCFEINNAALDLSVALCVSHPHGLSKRVTFGSVNSFNEESHSNSSLKLQLLVDKCSSIGISESKTTSVYYQSQRICQYHGLSSDYQTCIYNYLVSVGLLVNTTVKETNKVVTELKQLQTYLNTEVETSFKMKHGSDILSKGDKHLKKLKIRDQLLNDKTVNISVSDGFQDRIGRIEAELCRQADMIINGVNIKSMGLTQSVTYSTPTCPGSSGALMMMCKIDGTGVRQLMGHHSRGKGKNVGNVCGGGQSFFYD